MVLTVPAEFTGQRALSKGIRKGSGEMMGKSRKVSRGYASGFVPDYRHAVGTMAESEGFGSSGRVETEMTASDDSCTLKKKCVSLNADGYDRFGVPTEVWSFSKMSCSERKYLELRLRNELEQVRILQKKISSFSSNFEVLSPVSDIHSCSDGQRRLGVEVSQNFMKEETAPRGKKKGAPGRHGPRTKGAGARQPEQVKHAASSNNSIVMLMKQCETLLNRLMLHQYGWVFNAPVDVVKLKIPDYFTVIKHPMDLGTIKTKLISGEYLNPLEFAADVRLTFKNAMTYNPPGNDVHIMAQTLSKFFEVRWKPIEKKISLTVEILPSKSSVILETEAPVALPTNKKQFASFENKGRPEPVKQVMSDIEKHKLSTELEDLLAELPEKIIDFLKESSLNGSQVSEDEIEIDIDALSDDTLYKLRQLLDDYLLEKQKNQAKAEPCEMEIRNESGFSNSSLQPCKDNDPASEEIDIGGNDPAVSTFTPVEIEKDRARRNNKSSSSSSSRSDSGSSSSDSDSGSSSGGESGGAKVPIAINSPKVAGSSGVSLEQKELDRRDSREFLDGCTERNIQQKAIFDEPNDLYEGESAPPERQVSPEKLYRAALLRSRFADTILKAQEKTLEKGEARDPEMLKLEREELERSRREEKARLQAEAKAAEEACRKAEADAAAEAKKQRELEREAARQALLMMEKTVDINENSQFMEDLEMFRAAPDEQLERFIEETSPGHSQNGVENFKFKASSNPLEQLGLYMKEDDEDEEENVPHSVPYLSNSPEEDISNDPEEGEIDILKT